jgi:hypothetical protein
MRQAIANDFDNLAIQACSFIGIALALAAYREHWISPLIDVFLTDVFPGKRHD